jgi:hypothetical protein
MKEKLILSRTDVGKYARKLVKPATEAYKKDVEIGYYWGILPKVVSSDKYHQRSWWYLSRGEPTASLG